MFLTRAKVLPQASHSLNAVCPGLLLGDLQQAQDALECHVAHRQQNQNLHQYADDRQVSQSVPSGSNKMQVYLQQKREVWGGEKGGGGKKAMRVLIRIKQSMTYARVWNTGPFSVLNQL